MARGVIKRIKSEGGYGFIQPEENGYPDVFFHASKLRAGKETFAMLHEGQQVEYDTITNAKGVSAVEVEVIS